VGGNTGSSISTTGSILPSKESFPISEEEEVPYFYQPPAGWSVERPNNSSMTVNSNASYGNEISSSSDGDLLYNPRRVFDDDGPLGFDPREEFAGFRLGYVFRLGSKGLGYYEDKKKYSPC